MESPAEPSAPELPFPIYSISSNVESYMLYDINVITWLRKTHHILGVLMGTLPHVPQQNVFLGLPLKLLPEEARFLVEKGVAFVVVDSEWHAKSLKGGSAEQRQLYLNSIAREGERAAAALERDKMERTEKAMRHLRLDTPSVRSNKSSSVLNDTQSEASESFLFADGPSTKSPRSSPHPIAESKESWAMTPSTTNQMLPRPAPGSRVPLPSVKASSYAVFKQLHDHGYHMSPGLRFGCEFMAYPGDPLRYHSHFLAVSADWDKEIDLIDLVGGGRLGTGVKKGFLIGGKEPSTAEKETRTRTFCIEWGGM